MVDGQQLARVWDVLCLSVLLHIILFLAFYFQPATRDKPLKNVPELPKIVRVELLTSAESKQQLKENKSKPLPSAPQLKKNRLSKPKPPPPEPKPPPPAPKPPPPPPAPKPPPPAPKPPPPAPKPPPPEPKPPPPEPKPPPPEPKPPPPAPKPPPPAPKPPPPAPKPPPPSTARPEPKLSRLESIIKNLEKPLKKLPPVEPESDTLAKTIDQLSGPDGKENSDKDTSLRLALALVLDRHFSTCWSILGGARDAAKEIVHIVIKVDRDGYILSERLDESSARLASVDQAFQAHAESVLRAVRDPNCRRLTTFSESYAEYYDIWRDTSMAFDPSNIPGH